MDWNRLGEVNSYLKDFAAVQYTFSMDVWYGILNQQITETEGEILYIATVARQSYFWKRKHPKFYIESFRRKGKFCI